MANRVIRDIPELVKTLREQSARCKDLVVPNGKLEFVDVEVDDKDTANQIAVRIEGNGLYGVQKQANGQLAQKFGNIPMAYYSAMLEKATGLLATNLNHWLYEHAYVVAGARFGWWHGAEALQALIAVDRRAEVLWGVGSQSRTTAEKALAEVRSRSS